MVPATDVMTGLLTSVVYDVLKRPLRAFSDMRKVRRALAASGTRQDPSADTNDAIVRAAFDDLVKYIAHELGMYTNEMSNFLYELLRSSIPDTIKQLTMLGRDPISAYSSFKDLLDTFELTAIDSEKLYSLLCIAIKARFSNSIAPQSILEVINKRGDDVVARLEAIAKNVSPIEQSALMSASEFADMRLKIARHIEIQNKTLTVETTQGPRKVPIKKLVVPARMEEVQSQAEAIMPHRDAHREGNPPVPFINFRRSFFSAVILGDPGGGKTTLTQLLCFDLANQIILEASAPMAKHFDVADLKIPLRIVLRGYEKRLKNNPGYNFLDYVIDEMRIVFANDEDKCGAFFKQILNIGQAVLIFDGLDEILDVSVRREIASKIEEFSLIYPTCPALATSRIVGYNDAPLPYEFKVFTLSRFNKTEVEKFSINLLTAISQQKSPSAKEQAHKFLYQTEATAPDLRSNPLMLGLMLYIFIFKGDVPSNRPEIYKECSMLMFEKWDQRRGIVFDFPQDFDLLDLFGYLASRIFGDAEAEEGVNSEWLTKEVRQFFSNWYSDRAKSVDAARTLVDFITGRAWVMCEVGPSTFKFTHRTFLEYFFARRVEEEASGVGNLISDRLYVKIIAAEWDVVNHLALQIATFRSSPKSLQAVDALMSPDSISYAELTDDQRVNYLFFLTKALDYLVLPEAKLIQVCDYILSDLFTLRVFNYQTACEVIHGLMRYSKNKNEIVARHLSDSLEKIVSDKTDINRLKAIFVLGNVYAGFRARRLSPVNTEEFDLVWRSLSAARQGIKTALFVAAKKDLNEARWYIYIFKSDIAELFSIHGLNLAFFNGDETYPYDINSLGGIVTVQWLFAQVGPRGFAASDDIFNLSDIEIAADFVLREIEKLSLIGKLDEFWKASWAPSKEESLLDSLEVFGYASTKPKGIVRRLPKVSDAFFVLLSMQMHAHMTHGELLFKTRRHRTLLGAHASEADVQKLVLFLAGYANSEEKKGRIVSLGHEFAKLMVYDEDVETA
jgi:hypothetical protein